MAAVERYGAPMRPWRTAYAVAALGFLALFFSWTHASWPGTRAFVDLSSTAIPFGAAALAFWRAGVLPGERRIAWQLLGLGCTAWALGNVAWTYYELVADFETPFPSLADLGYVLLIPFAAAALLAMVVGTTAKTSRLRTLVDGVFIAASMLFLARALFLRPLLEYAGQQEGILAQALAIAYPLGDILLVSLLLLVMSRVTAGVAHTLAWLGLGLACLTIADTGYWYLTALGTYETGSWADAGWVAAFLSIGYAALRPVPAIPATQQGAPGFGTTIIPLVPFLAATALAMAIQVREGSLEPFLFWNAILTVTLLAIRQFLIVAENIQLRRQAERALQMVREQQVERNLMLNTVTHDILSPLSAVRIQTNILTRHEALDEKQKRSVGIVHRNVEAVARLARDLKDLANLEAGHFRLEEAQVDLAEVARQACETFADAAGEAGLALRCEVDGRLVVQGDRGRLDQVLYNLVSNAIRYTPKGEVHVWAHARKGQAVVAVRDTGRGLDPDEAGRLFKPFSQVHDRSEARERGTGLGLYISRSIAESHGGTLRVESDGKGKGSTFFLELPRREGEPLAPKPLG